ncbi:MAG TPA: peptidylprolyl isomerase [Thermoanaerobaculia bacterium]|jgi:peptidyl-prolyl cis-trans isomerase D
MLKFMRDSFQHLKWILLAIVLAFVFGFVFVDMGLGGRVGGANADRAYAARVNGETITYSDYYRALKNYEDMYRQMYGQQFTPQMAEAMGLNRQVLETLIDQRLITQEAKRLHLNASPEEVRRKLLTIPVFAQDGKFVGMELYNRYVTGPLGYPSASAFEEDLAREIVLAKMDSALSSSVVISPQTAEAEYRRTNETAKIRYVLLAAQKQAATVTVSPAEVEAYYRNNQSKYTHGEQRMIRYLLADFAKIRSQILPTDAQLRERYAQNRENFRTPEAAHVLHILVKVDPSAPPQVDAAARAKAQSIVQQLRAGADFATLARANSDDPSSSSGGGDMGWVEKGQTVPEFESAIFGIPLNTVSDPVRSKNYGYHIVKVVERRAAGIRPFEEVRPEIAARMSDEEAREQARVEITRIAAQLKQKPPKNAEEFSAFSNDKVSSNDGGWVGKSDQIAGIGAHQPLTQWLFSAKKGDIGTEPLGTPRGIVIPYLVDVRPAGVSTLNEIRAKVEEDARLEKARTAATAMLRQMMAGTGSIDDLAARTGVPVREANVNRQGTIAGITGDVTALVEAAMRANPNVLSGPVSTDEGAVVFQVTEQKKVTAAELLQNRASYIDNLRDQQSRNLRGALVRRLREGSRIEINEQVLKTSEGQQPQQGS